MNIGAAACQERFSKECLQEGIAGLCFPSRAQLHCCRVWAELKCSAPGNN